MRRAVSRIGGDEGGASDAERQRRLVLALLATLLGLAAMAAPVSSPVPFLGWYLLSSVAVAIAVTAYRADRALPVAAVVAVVVVALGFWGRADADRDPFLRDHDGGVVATDAAARMVLDGRNPYAADFTEALSPHHSDLGAIDDQARVNPLVEHYPYLPAAFLVHVPFTALGDLVGDVYDPRILYTAVVVLALGVVASDRTYRPSSRAAALLAMTLNGAVAVYLPWGANDSAAAGAVVAGVLLARRRPLLAGILLAVGISTKALLVVVLLPLVVLWRLTSSSALRSALVACVVALGASCVPFLVAAPRAFVDDTVLFNLGATELNYPTSGIGLGALFGDALPTAVVLASSVVLVAAASAVAVAVVRRTPAPEVALWATGVVVFAGLLPARSFQLSYAPLFVVLWGPVWRLVDRHPPDRPAQDDSAAPA